MEDNEKVQGRTFTSNHVKLLKHMDKLQLIQDGKRPSPVMFHLSPCNACNLTCSFCCYANRNLKQMLTLDQCKKAIDAFHELGTRGMELTGGGSPSLHPQFHEIIEYAYKKDFKIGVCTNGTTLKKWAEKGTWAMLSWIRLGLYNFTEGYNLDIDVLEGLPLTISAAYVWDMNVDTSDNPNIKLDWYDTKGKRPAKNIQEIEDFYRMLDWVEEKKIPTRIAFNTIKSNEQVESDIEIIRGQLKQWEAERGREVKYAFLSDFNYKGKRRNDHCYMAQVKPFVFTNGGVYTCPSSVLATENGYNVNEEFKLCDIDGILDYYNNHGSEMRHHNCSICKYAYQNELIDDILTPTQHNDFA